MSVRTEQTLRDMWEAGARRTAEAEQWEADANGCAAAAQSHERAAAAEAAAANSAHEAARAKYTVAHGKKAEAADLADLVNRERIEAGLSPLTPGEPYPADPAPVEQPTPEDTLVASAESSTVTRTDGEVAK